MSCLLHILGLAEIARAENIDVVHNNGLFTARIGTAGIPDKEMSGFFQSAASVEQVLFARNFDAYTEVVVRFQVLHNHVGEVMDVDYHLANAKVVQASEGDLKQRAAVNFAQRFGAIVAYRPQTRA